MHLLHQVDDSVSANYYYHPRATPMPLHKSALGSAIVIGDSPVTRDSRSISPRRTAMSDDDRETPALEQSHRSLRES